MSSIIIANQVHNPSPKKARIDAQGNNLKRLWLKDGTTTMLFAQGLTEMGCRALINHINTWMIQCGKKAFPKTRWLITQ